MTSGNDQFFGVDFGTANTCISQWGGGVVLYEPTVALKDTDSYEPVAVGAQALALMKKMPGNFSVEYPIRRGRILDFELARYVLRYFMRKVQVRRYSFFHAPKAALCIPCGLPATEMYALEYAAQYAGIKDVLLLEEPVAAAIGAGMDVAKPIGRMIVKMGREGSCAAVVTMAGVATYEKIEMGDTRINAMIAGYVSDKYGIGIGNMVAERVKGSLGKDTEKEGFSVTGRSALTGFPEEVFLYPEEFQPVLQSAYTSVVDAVLRLFKKTSPELVSDISEEGLLFYGGGSLLYGLRDFVENSIQLPVRIMENPEYTLAQGAAVAAGTYLGRRKQAVI